MHSYCTLFDSSYLSRGLAMYESLARCSASFHLFIFAFDDIALRTLRALKLPSVTVVSLKEFESEDLLAIKPGRTRGEYCWTCTPSIIRYCIDKFDLEACTYLDADLFFYSDPSILLDELGDDSVLITEHRYTSEYDQSATSGRFCVQFITFRNDENGMSVLHWWRQACIEWCYARFEDGKFGDQKYLDDWPERFEGVHILANHGGGVAPWNVDRYKFRQESFGIIGKDRYSRESFHVIFFHFHGLRFLPGNSVSLCKYHINRAVFRFFYQPYITKLIDLESRLINLGFRVENPRSEPGKIIKDGFQWKIYVKILAWRVTRPFSSIKRCSRLRASIAYVDNLHHVDSILKSNG